MSKTEVKVPSEPEQDPGVAVAARRKGSKTDEALSHIPRKVRGSIVNAKVSPRYPYKCEASTGDFIYGPFHYDAVDEGDAKSQMLQQYPDLMEAVTKLTFSAVRLSDEPVNLDRLTEVQVAKINRNRRRMNAQAKAFEASFGRTGEDDLEVHRQIVDSRDETTAAHTGPSQEDIDSGAAAGPRTIGGNPESPSAATKKK